MPTVLLAEDDRGLLEAYFLWLDGIDAVSVRTATDGREAKEQVDGDVDLTVLDRRMPGATGDEVARFVRSTNADCTVVIVSAFEPDGSIAADDYDRYLTKPVRRERLVTVVRRELGDRTAVD